MMNNLSFTSALFSAVQPVLQRIFNHPFNKELAAGTLSRERFCFYMQQDSVYLLHFARALALTGSRSIMEKRIESLLSAAQNALLAERSLHEHYFREYGVTETGKENRACVGYTSFLLSTASLGTLGEALAALLPCFWIYREVGCHVTRIAASPNPYARWIDMYSDREFSLAVDRFVSLVDDVAGETTEEERLSMKDCFMVAAHYEYYFWDEAYLMKPFDCTLESLDA